MSARELMWRDLEQLGIAGVSVLFALPLAALVLALKGSRVAIAVAVVCAALGVTWAGYYATDAPNPGIAGAAGAALVVVLCWAALIVDIARRARRARP